MDISRKKMTHSSVSFKSWIVVLCSALFFFYEFIQMNMPNSIADNLMLAFQIDGLKVSNLSAAYFYADIVMLFPAGFILDRFSTRKVILIALIVCACSSLGFALSQNYWLAFSMRLLTGLGAAFNLLSSVRLASRWFPPQQLALITGLIVTMAMLGGVVAQTPVTVLVEHLGWRNAMMLDSILGFAFVIVIYFTVFDYPAHYQKTHEKNIRQLHSMGLMKTLRLVLSNRQNWTAGFYTCFLNLPVFIIGGLWGIPYLQAVDHMSKTEASVVSTMLFIGMIFGSPLLGRLSDRLGRRRLPMLFFGIVALGVIAVILFMPSLNFSALLLLYALLGFVTSAQIISYPVIAESNSPAVTSSAMGLGSLIIMSGGAVFQPLVGWLLTLNWNGQMNGSLPLYNATDFHQAFLVLPVAFIVAIVASFFTKETYCKNQESA